MQQTALDRIVEAILNDESLNNALLAHLIPSPSPNTSIGGQHIGSIHPGTGAQQTNPELAMQMYQSGSKPTLVRLLTHPNQVDDVVDEFAREHPRCMELVNLLSDDAETV